MSNGNGYKRAEIKALQEKLKAVQESARKGDNTWRDRQRQRYLEKRLRQAKHDN